MDPHQPQTEYREDGLRWLIVTSGWSDQLARLVNSGQVDGVELNSTKGSWGSGIEFLADVPRLRHLILINLVERRVEPIAQLTELRTLNLNAYATSPLDFAGLISLEGAFIEWCKPYRNLSSCTRLEDLHLNRYGDADLTALRTLDRLRRLRIGDSRMVSSLDGIECARQLRSVGLYGLPKLSTLEPLKCLATNLEELDVKQCRGLGNLDMLGHLSALRRVILADCGKVPSLQPLAALPNLEELYFYGDTLVVDGDLEFLRTLGLKHVAFRNRRHYSLRREELPGYTP